MGDGDASASAGEENKTEASVVRRIVRFLACNRKHDDYACHMTLLSPLLPPRAADAPRLSLKRLCLERQDVFEVTEVGESCLVRLRDPASAEAVAATGTGTGTEARTGTEAYEHDYDALELRIIAHLYRLPDRKTSLPSLGEYCKVHLGVDMKHRLAKFLDKRSAAFARDRDGRQQVWLVLNGPEEVNGYVRDRFGGDWEGPGLDALRESVADVAGGEGGGRGGGGGDEQRVRPRLGGLPDSLGPEFWGAEDFPSLASEQRY